MAKTIDSAYELLEDMAANNYQWLIKKAMNRKVVGIHEIDAITALTAQVAASSKKFDTIGVNAIQSPYVTYEICRSITLPINAPSISNLCNVLVIIIGRPTIQIQITLVQVGELILIFHGAIIQGPLQCQSQVFH